MPLPAKLHVTLTRTFDNKPLAVLQNLPGEGAELRPAQLRALAAALLAAADDCAKLDLRRKHAYPVKHEYDLAVDPAQSEVGSRLNDLVNPVLKQSLR